MKLIGKDKTLQEQIRILEKILLQNKKLKKYYKDFKN